MSRKRGRLITDLPTPFSSSRGEGSMLPDGKQAWENNRRAAEQNGHRRLASVKARERSNDEPTHSPEGELQNSMLQHPELNTQRFDGVDSPLNPEPAWNTDARRELENELRNQKIQKQLRLGNQPKFNTAPKPQRP